MVWGVQRTRSRIAGALSLLGVAFYALLLPWHLVSQFDRQLFAAEFGVAAELICSGGTGADVPGAPASGCPICKGLAAFQIALAPAPQILAPPASVRAPAALALREDVVSAEPLRPRSRGPPSQV
jgi:hypothetical protein